MHGDCISDNEGINLRGKKMQQRDYGDETPDFSEFSYAGQPKSKAIRHSGTPEECPVCQSTRASMLPPQFKSQPSDLSLPDDSASRKNFPIAAIMRDYFPKAFAYVALVAKHGNDQHNPGQPMHWAREKSSDHSDCIARHLIDLGRKDGKGVRHSGNLAWRALANLQLELEAAEARGEKWWND